MKRRHTAIGNIYKALLFAAAAFFAVAAVGCRADVLPETEQATRFALDDLGRKVIIPLRVDRAVSLAPSTTEMIFAAGAGNRLVGVTTYCNYPTAALSIPKVGDTQTPNIETIVAMRPQIVFVSTASQLEAFTELLEKQNIAVFVTNPANINDVLKNLREFGEIFGTQAVAQSRIADLQERLTRVESKVAGKSPVRVFVQVSDNPLFTIGRKSFLTEAVERSGGASVTREIESAYTIISKETAMALNPDAIILSESTDNLRPNVVFNNSAAVRNHRVYHINADLLSRPGPRLLDAMEQMATHLHGEDWKNP